MSTEATAACLAEYARSGPRYTSYPPATEFAPMSADRVERELTRVGASAEPISLYVHVPFCRSLCAYCGCNVIPTRDESRGDAYVAQVTNELELVAASLPSSPVVELALGGGSPNFLPPTTLRALLAAVERTFTIARGARRSIELDPRSTTSSQLEVLGALQFTSVSVGVQDFAEPVQDAIRRHQSVVQTRWLVERARAAGLTDVNIDVVYGLPRQTEDSFRTTIDTVIGLEPDRVALFGYAHMPSRLPHQKLVERAGRVLDLHERATLLLLAIERFTAAGYVHLGLDHFARPGSRLARAAAEGRMARTFQGYVERIAEAIIGIGTSAISSTRRMYWQNHTQLRAWEQALAAGRLPVQRGFVLDRDDRARRALIERLMCDGEVDLRAIAREHALDADRYFAAEVERLAEVPDLALYDASTATVKTTPIGKLLVRNVCMLFDRYLDDAVAGAPRFSPTI